MKKLVALFLALVMTLSLCSVTSFATTPEPVGYLKADGTTATCTDYTVMTEDTTTWAAGWYVVNDNVYINNKVSLTGDVNLIIEAEKKLFVYVQAESNLMIDLNGHTLTVYGQNNYYELNQWGGMNSESNSSCFLISSTGITPIGSSTAGGKFVVNSGFVDIEEDGDNVYLSKPLFGSNVEVTINNGAAKLKGAVRSSQKELTTAISIGGKAVTINNCAAVMAQGGHAVYEVNGGGVYIHEEDWANAFDPKVTTLTVDKKLLVATDDWTDGFKMKSTSDTAQVTLYFMNVTEKGACKIGSTGYPSLAKAVSAVADGEMIALNMWNTETVTVSKAITFKVDAGEYTNGATVNAGAGYQVAKSVNGTVTTYTVTEADDDGCDLDCETLAKVGMAAAGVVTAVVVTKVVVDKIHAIKAACDAETAIKAVEMPMVAMGDSGDAVTTLQTELNAQGYACGEVDGVFGQNTLNAVMAFQTAKGLTADGVVGAQTWGALL